MTVPVCVIGLGLMGFGAAVSLLRAGFDVRGVDVRLDARERFVEAGGRAMSSPAEGTQGCAMVFVFVVNVAQTEAVLFGSDGAADVLAPSSVIVGCAPDAVERLATALLDNGLLMQDAPVSGGAAKAAAGDMTVMAAGCDEAFAKAAPFLDAIAAPRSAVDIFVKDLGLVLETSNGWTFPAPLAAAAHQLFKAASAAGLGGENDIAVVKTYLRASPDRVQT